LRGDGLDLIKELIPLTVITPGITVVVVGGGGGEGGEGVVVVVVVVVVLRDRQGGCDSMS